MSYHEALEAAGAKVLSFEMFGSYQGDWFAKVSYQERTFYVHGSFGSCSVCDAFEAEFGFDGGELCDEHKYDYDRPKDCPDCIAKTADYNKRLADFGRSYLESGDMTQDEAEACASENLEWDSDAQSMLDWLKAVR